MSGKEFWYDISAHLNKRLLKFFLYRNILKNALMLLVYRTEENLPVN